MSTAEAVAGALEEAFARRRRSVRSLVEISCPGARVATGDLALALAGHGGTWVHPSPRMSAIEADQVPYGFTSTFYDSTSLEADLARSPVVVLDQSSRAPGTDVSATMATAAALASPADVVVVLTRAPGRAARQAARECGRVVEVVTCGREPSLSSTLWLAERPDTFTLARLALESSDGCTLVLTGPGAAATSAARALEALDAVLEPGEIVQAITDRTLRVGTGPTARRLAPVDLEDVPSGARAVILDRLPDTGWSDTGIDTVWSLGHDDASLGALLAQLGPEREITFVGSGPASRVDAILAAADTDPDHVLVPSPRNVTCASNPDLDDDDLADVRAVIAALPSARRRPRTAVRIDPDRVFTGLVAADVELDAVSTVLGVYSLDDDGVRRSARVLDVLGVATDDADVDAGIESGIAAMPEHVGAMLMAHAGHDRARARAWLAALATHPGARAVVSAARVRASLDEVDPGAQGCGIEVPESVSVTSHEVSGANLVEVRTRRGHLFADADGTFPVKTNDWESRVLDIEVPRCLAWYRNPPRGQSALAVPYVDGAATGMLHPDFVFVCRDAHGQAKVSVVDPHMHAAADTGPKWRALSAWARAHAGAGWMGRVWAVIWMDEALWRLDLTQDRCEDLLADMATKSDVERVFRAAGCRYESC